MEVNIPSLLTIDINYVVVNIGEISKGFTRPLDLPTKLIELIFIKYLKYDKYIEERELQYFLAQKAQFSSIDFSSSQRFNNSWINLLPVTIINLGKIK